MVAVHVEDLCSIECLVRETQTACFAGDLSACAWKVAVSLFASIFCLTALFSNSVAHHDIIDTEISSRAHQLECHNKSSQIDFHSAYCKTAFMNIFLSSHLLINKADLPFLFMLYFSISF